MKRRHILATLVGWLVSMIPHTPTGHRRGDRLATANPQFTGLTAAIEEIDGQVSTLIESTAAHSAEMADARDAGMTNGSVRQLRDRIEYAAASAYHPMAYGAVGDGFTDDSEALNTLWNTTMRTGGHCVIDRPYSIQSPITIPEAITLVFVRGGMLNVVSTRDDQHPWRSACRTLSNI